MERDRTHMMGMKGVLSMRESERAREREKRERGVGRVTSNLNVEKVD